MWTRADLKSKAKEDVKRSYWGLVLVSFVVAFLTGGGGGGGSSAGSSSASDYAGSSDGGSAGGFDTAFLVGLIVGMLVVFVVAFIIGIAFATFVTNPIMVGAQRYYIEATYGQKSANEIGTLFCVFKKGVYMNVVKTMFLRDLYVGLWSLLFIIPGIIKGYEYRMIPYILAENPELESSEVFRLTKEMMDGNKWDTFVLGWSFFGWNLLSVFTCGLLSIFYVNPYMKMTYARLYETLKHRASKDYYDHSLAGNGYAYSSSYGNPGAYAQPNAYGSSQGTYEQPQTPSYTTGEVFNPSAPIEEDPYRLPGDEQ